VQLDEPGQTGPEYGDPGASALLGGDAGLSDLEDASGQRWYLPEEDT
jgi:hypothetical protein